MSKRKSLVIYLPSLASGGAERAHTNMAPAFIAAGFDVTFLVHRAEGAYVAMLPPGARLVSLDCRRTLAALLPLARFLKKERPDILISNLGHNNIMAIWARMLARTPVRIVACHHNSISGDCAAKDNWQYRVLPLLCRLFLRRADAIVAVSNGAADDIARRAGLSRERITTIYNPIVTRDFDQCMNEPVTHPWLAEQTPVVLGAGRFVKEKDFAALVAAFALVLKQRDARLILLGEGPLRDDLIAQAEALGIKDRVDLPGFQPNPLPFMRAAAVLAVPSRYEGFGNVLVEAMACGTPVVSADCPFGPREILDNGRYGTLAPVDDPEALAAAILAVLAAPPPRDTLKARGREFTVERAAAAYMELF